MEGKIRTRVTNDGWYLPTATFTVVADGLKPLIGCKIYEHLGLAVKQPLSQKANQWDII